jgi:hypothetical protein
MNATVALYWAQADRFREIAERATKHSNVYSFNPVGQQLWIDIAKAARKCRVDRIELAYAVERV